jgi:hypothetical protein
MNKRISHLDEHKIRILTNLAVLMSNLAASPRICSKFVIHKSNPVSAKKIELNPRHATTVILDGEQE